MLCRMLLSLLRMTTGSVLLNTLLQSVQNLTLRRTDASSASSTLLMKVASVYSVLGMSMTRRSSVRLCTFSDKTFKIAMNWSRKTTRIG